MFKRHQPVIDARIYFLIIAVILAVVFAAMLERSRLRNPTGADQSANSQIKTKAATGIK